MAPRPSTLGWDYAACLLLSGVPVISHLVYHAVDFMSVDAWGLLVLALSGGLVLAWLVQRCRPWVRNVLLTLLTLTFVDLQFHLEDLVGFRYVVVAAMVPAWILTRHYTRIVTASAGAILLSVPFGPPTLAVRSWHTAANRSRQPDARLAPIVHIVLDGHASPAAFPVDIPEARAARDRLLQFYQQHGFRLYAKAYSRFFWTHSSIPATLSPRAPSAVFDTMTQKSRDSYIAKDSHLFQWAASKGYRVHVVQSSHLDVCSRSRPLVESCRTYPVNSQLSLNLLSTSAPRRVFLESLYYLFTESRLVQLAQDFSRKRQGVNLGSHNEGTSFPGWAAGRAHAGMTLRELAQLGASLETEFQGSLIFAHFMLPHDPYELDRACGVRVRPGERLAHGWMDGFRGNTPASRRARWALYGGQVECLYTHLDSLIRRIDSASPSQGTLIVIHGDHGSRISLMTGTPGATATLSDQDAIDGFATLLAVRGPGILAGIDSTVVATQDLVPKLITGDSSLDVIGPDPTPRVTLMWHGSKGRAAIWLPAPALAR